MLGYARTRDKNHAELQRRKKKIFMEIPEYRRLEEAFPKRGIEALRKRLLGTPSDASDESEASSLLPNAVSALYAQQTAKKELLLSHGYPEDYLDEHFDCPCCQDTGYINGEKCRCLKLQEIGLLYDQSHLKQLARYNNFSLLSREFYQGEDLLRFTKAAELCRRFVSDFNHTYKNIYFYGTVGTGKSFLSICCGSELLQMGYSVLYFSAADLFDRLSDSAFDYHSRDVWQDLNEDLYTCDCLIIDDLGTELTNNFINTRLFTLINERHIRQKATIISTNLQLEEIQHRYSDRLFSRIMSGYEICKLSGPDIRLFKKRQRKRK